MPGHVKKITESAPTNPTCAVLCCVVLCSHDALAPVGLARWDVDRLYAALVGGLPYRLTSMLQASCSVAAGLVAALSVAVGGEHIFQPSLAH
jgi:hypothetical protein